MANNVITIRKETAQAFFPAGAQWSGEIDVDALAGLAKAAMAGSAQSLAAAQDIADGNVISRMWNSGDMQKHIINSITHLGDLSKVNLGLSAICNDLAAANLEHASRIDKNHHATNQQLNQVQQLTGELLAHLRKPREPALLERLLPALSQANPADQDAMRSWLRTLTEEIDLQYVVLQENLEKLTLKSDYAVETVTRFRTEIASFSESITNQKADVIQQFGLLSSRLTTGEIESGRLTDMAAKTSQELKQLTDLVASSVTASTQRADKTDSNIRKSHELLGTALTTLNQQLARHQSEFQTAIQSEHASRDAMQQSIVSLIKQREGAIRTTIGELNQHLLKRMLWGGGGIVVLQVLGFGFLAFKMGLFK